MSRTSKRRDAATPARRAFSDGELHQAGIEIHAEGARAAPRRGDDDAPVARAQVDQRVAGAHLRDAQHALDDLRRRHDERHRAVVPGPAAAICAGGMANAAREKAFQGELSSGKIRSRPGSSVDRAAPS
jgi:hypothetical protein